ncbi:prolyl oligopeptidase family serine peptidase [Actinokineospora auranticolor]|uniref:Dipeptidyl aminopeptidase/acylaminoacyl peptidase n=1 Tax=Actinokineospora auranticolor TaxID=155976 RepID=A0A2S6GKV9_9PSEU|nr:prolyl oligopeptidase family serine peptidase [Actinokineospora auranticolor]PPK65849.1 dipeptidyl aminopeptidase/acylaminoacyl peptidase [Actinokineospora auranticolor]
MTTHPVAEVPDRLFADDEAEARWRARFHAARVSLPDWALEAPDRTVYVSNASGVWEVYAWDRATDTHRQVTDRPNGTLHATVTPDGERILWFNDTDGDEFGDWMAEPFAGRPVHSEPEPAVPGAKRGYPAGLAYGDAIRVAGVADDDGTTIYLARGEADAEVIYQNEHDGGVAALSHDETLLAIAHSEHGDNRHPALRVLAVADGSTVAEKWDGKGKGLTGIAFSPVAGDQRLLVLHERRGREELLIWDVAADTEREITLDLPGEVEADWYTDGTALLVAHTHEARNTLHRYDIATAELSTLNTPPGTIGSAHTRPDGTVEYSWSNAAEPSAVRALFDDGTDRVLLTPPGDRAPSSAPLVDAFVETAHGRVHALVARPVGAPDGPLPTVFSLHGGPHAADEDRFSAYRALWVDAGFAVVHVNYRGSTGYGSAWRDAIEGRPGLTELDDVRAVHTWAVESGLADPARCVVNGASWGGYLTLLALGTQPDLWAAGVAGVPVADYLAAYEDEMEPLRAFDRALFGGSPAEVGDRYAECSPITYVDQVRAPVLVLAGENDPRCPIRQIDNYLDRLAAREQHYEVYRYDAGHGSLVVAETIKQSLLEVHFALRVLGLR